MSTTATTPERSHAPYAEPDEYVEYQLRKTQMGIKRIDMMTAAMGAVTLLIGYVLLFVVCDHWLFDEGMSRITRLLIWLPVVGAVGWMIGTKVVWPALRNVSGLFAAKTLEASAPGFRSSLLSLIDLKRSNRPVAPIIMATMEKRAAVTFTKFNVEDAIDKRLLLRTLYVLFGIVVTFCLYSVLSPKKLGPSVLRAILPFSNVRPATQTEILEVKPGHAKLRAGGSLPIEVQLRGETPPDVRLFFTTADRRFKNELVELSPTTDTQRYVGTLGQDEQGLLQSFSYFVVAGDARSPEYNVEIITPPSATVHDVRCEFPEYTELDPTTQMGGAIDVWERTVVTINAATNMRVARTEFELSDTQDFAAATSHPGPSPKLDEDGRRLTIRWRADPRQANVALPGQSNSPFPKFYRIKVWDDEGHPDPKPAVYPISVRVDQSPQVVLLDPTINLEMPVNGIVPLAIAARDPDFKLRTVSLKIARDANDVTDETLFDGAQQEVSLRHDFALESLRLQPGDKVRFWIEAQDNRLPTHNLAKTTPLEITIKGRVTKDEAKKQLAEQKQEQQQRLNEALKNNDSGTERTEQQPSDASDPPEQRPRAGDEPDQQPKSDDPKAERPNPDQQNPNAQEDKKGNQTGHSGQPSDKQQPGGKSDKSQSGGMSKSDPSTNKKQEGEPSLKNDGTDDDRALQKIAEREQRRGRWPKNKPQNSPPDGSPSNADNNPSEKPKSDNSDNSEDPSSPDQQPATPDKSNKPDKQRVQSGSKNTPSDSPQTDNDPADKPKTDGDSRQNSGEPKDNEGTSKPSNSKPKPDKSPKGNDSDNTPSGDNPKTSDVGDKPDADSENNSGRKKPDEKKRPGGNDQKSQNNADKPNDNGDKTPRPVQGDDSQKPESPKQDKSSKPGSDSNDDDQSKQKPGAGNDDKPSKPNDGKQNPSDKKSRTNNVDDMNATDKADQPNSQKPPSADKNNASDKEDSPQKPNRGQPNGKQSDPTKKPGQESPDGKQSPDGDKGPDGKDGKSKSDQPGDSGKPSQSDKAGKSPSDKAGDGESSDDPKGGKPSDKMKPGKSSKGSPSNQKSDGPLGKPSGSSGGGGLPGDEEGDGRGQPQDKDGKPARKQSDQSGSASGSNETEPVNELFTKEAANLVLKRLQGELERGEVDQELLDELGWTPEQMKKFLERMEQNFEAKPDDNSPAAKARRRQFEEMLRNLDLTSKAQRRDDTNKDKQSGDGVGSVRRPPPPHLRDWWESYTKGLSKKQAGDQPKK